MAERRLDEPDGQDVVGSSPSFEADGRWSRMSARSQVRIKVAAAVLAAGAVVGYGLAEGRGWQQRRALEDTVSLSAAMNVSSSSTTPSGGSVDFYITLENTGGASASISALEVVVPRLVITGQLTEAGRQIEPLRPSEVARVPLSVVLDCRPTGAELTTPVALVAAVRAMPPSGRSRTVEVPVTQGNLVTDIADTLCALDPGRHDAELDGPVVTS